MSVDRDEAAVQAKDGEMRNCSVYLAGPIDVLADLALIEGRG